VHSRYILILIIAFVKCISLTISITVLYVEMEHPSDMCEELTTSSFRGD
jgi:hypothetical protein